MNPDFWHIHSKIVDALSRHRRRYQSFRKVWYKSAVDCSPMRIQKTRNANKCLKIAYSSMVKKVKKLSGIHAQIRITAKSQPLLEGHLCPCLPSLVDVRFHVRQLSCLQNERIWHNEQAYCKTSSMKLLVNRESISRQTLTNCCIMSSHHNSKLAPV